MGYPHYDDAQNPILHKQNAATAPARTLRMVTGIASAERIVTPPSLTDG
ncbi:hypothetical protein [Mesorhizobium sp.]|nr:hypothetical protein [Mesorhizobium sp.]